MHLLGTACAARSMDIPTAGAKVSVEGLWQTCALGRGYKLNEIGSWVPNSGDPNNKTGFLNALNAYHSDVCIVVGTQDPDTMEWQPVSIIAFLTHYQSRVDC